MPKIDLRDLDLLEEDEDFEITDKRSGKRSKEFKIRKEDLYYDKDDR